MRIPVAVTGLAAHTALGEDLSAFRAGLQEGRSGIAPLRLFAAEGYRSMQVGQAPEPEPPGAPPPPPHSSRPDRFGLRAALQALADAALPRERWAELAVYFGTGTGGASETERYMEGQIAGVALSAELLLPHQPAAVTDLVARAVGSRGPRSTIMTACSSSAAAIGLAGDLVASGRVPAALVGGAEGLCRLTLAGFGALRALDPEPCRPFDAQRRGLNLGEGAAALVLEPLPAARARGARVYGLLAGYGSSADGHHMTAPHPRGEGAARAMRAALRDAGLAPAAIGYINAHGTATPQNDEAETAAIKAVFGAEAPPVSSIKAAVGHTLGAAGAIEAVAALLALHHGFLPPTVNHRQADAHFGLDYIPGAARDQRVDAVLSSSFAFGGNNAVLVFRRGDDA